MKQQWLEWSEKVAQMQVREKQLLLGVGLFLIIYLLLWYVILPSHSDLNRDNTAYQKVSRELKSKVTQQQMIQQALSRNYLAEIELKIKEKQSVSLQIDKQLAALKQTFVEPDKMVLLLRQVLRENNKLQLFEFKIEAPHAIYVDNDKERGPVFYQHNLVVQVEGGFFDILNYVKQLGSMKDKLYIQQLDYNVLEYPKARLKLIITTVSSNEKAISI